MNKLFVLFLITAIASICKGQSPDTSCNRKTLEGRDVLLKNLPGKLCIPTNMILAGVHPPTDINKDGLPDVVVNYFKEGFSDGDTLYTGIYFMNKDSSYSLISQLGKLDLLYFEIQSPDYFKKMRLLTGNRYVYDTLAGKHGYPVNNRTEFKEDKIIITLEPGVGDKYIFEYTYHPGEKNWVQTKITYFEGTDDIVENAIAIDQPAPFVTDFNITDYL